VESKSNHPKLPPEEAANQEIQSSKLSQMGCSFQGIIRWVTLPGQEEASHAVETT
jgi:hypothetical protein